MTRAEIAAIVDRYTEGFRQRNLATLAALYGPNSTVQSPMFATLHGGKAIEEANRAFLTVFPDLQTDVDSIVIDSPRAAIFSTFQATHVGELYGLPGTHRRVKFTIGFLMTIQDGVIIHELRIYDFTGLLVQVGVLRAKPA